MNIARTTVTLGNPARPGLAIEVVALAGTGATHLCLPAGVARRLEAFDLFRGTTSTKVRRTFPASVTTSLKICHQVCLPSEHDLRAKY